MENTKNEQQCAIHDVSNSAMEILRCTPQLRWKYQWEIDTKLKVLQQLWIDDKGVEIWKDVETVM